jgi:nucleoside-specific outer membrane channel protein Tsx
MHFPYQNPGPFRQQKMAGRGAPAASERPLHARAFKPPLPRAPHTFLVQNEHAGGYAWHIACKRTEFGVVPSRGSYKVAFVHCPPQIEPPMTGLSSGPRTRNGSTRNLNGAPGSDEGSSMRRFPGSAAATAVALTLMTGSALAFDFSDTSVSVTYGPDFKEPGVVQSNNPNKGTSIDKIIATLTHFDVYKYGTNFINIDALFSNGRDPANNSTNGAVEVYGIYRGNLSGNSVFDTKAFTFGPVKDVRFEFGGDFNTKNTSFAPEKKLLVLGPNISLDVPGFLNVGLHYAQEWNNNGIVGRSVQFDPTFEMEIVWMQPLTFTGLPLRFDGFFNLVTPKGKDGFGAETKTEILTQPRIVLDVGALVWDKPNTLDFYVGYQYWLNKFGNNHSEVPGSIASTVFVGTTLHF